MLVRSTVRFRSPQKIYMPWSVQKQGERWAIVRSDTGEVVGHSDSKEMALASVRARYANTTNERMTGRKK